MEKFLYESRPYNLGLIALICTKWVGHDMVAILSVATLAASAIIIFRWRYQYRMAPQPRRR